VKIQSASAAPGIATASRSVLEVPMADNVPTASGGVSAAVPLCRKLNFENDVRVMVKKYGNAVFLQETLWKERKLDLEMVKALLHKAPTAVHKTDTV